MLKHFYRISGVRVGVYDADLSIITDCPHQSENFDEYTFCEKLKTCSPKYMSECDVCDTKAFERVRMTKKPYIYCCHMNFAEAVIPIMAGGEPICYLMIGQVKIREGSAKNKDVTSQWLKDRLSIYQMHREGVTYEEVAEDYNKMRVLDMETFKSYVYFLNLCAQKIYSDGYVTLKYTSITKALAEFVGGNLYNDIKISDFAKKMGLSTSYVSHTIAKNMNTTFTKYLNECRIEEAKRLLKTTDMSVKRIAVMLKYTDVAYFVRRFKSEVGMTCTEYRNSCNGVL